MAGECCSLQLSRYFCRWEGWRLHSADTQQEGERRPKGRGKFFCLKFSCLAITCEFYFIKLYFYNSKTNRLLWWIIFLTLITQVLVSQLEFKSTTNVSLEINSFEILIWENYRNNLCNLKFVKWPLCIIQLFSNGDQESKVIFNLYIHLAFLAQH